MSKYDKFGLGACGCGCIQTFTVRDCNGVAVVGATVALYTSSGGTLLASGTTTSPLGQVTLSWSGSSGTYWIVVNGTGQSVSVTCGNVAVVLPYGTTCYPCVLPAKDLTLHYSGSAVFAPKVSPLFYSGPTCTWDTGCIPYNGVGGGVLDHARFLIHCTPTCTYFVSYATDCTDPAGYEHPLGCSGIVLSSAMTLDSFTCQPLSIVIRSAPTITWTIAL